MANARIDPEIDQKTRAFKSGSLNSVRSKSLDKGHWANSTGTIYVMNEVLTMQDCSLTWI